MLETSFSVRLFDKKNLLHPDTLINHFPRQDTDLNPSRSLWQEFKKADRPGKYLFRIWLICTDAVEKIDLFHVSTFSPGGTQTFFFSFGGPKTQTSRRTMCQKRACYYDCTVLRCKNGTQKPWQLRTNNSKFYIYYWSTCDNIFCLSSVFFLCLLWASVLLAIPGSFRGLTCSLVLPIVLQFRSCLINKWWIIHIRRAFLPHEK